MKLPSNNNIIIILFGICGMLVINANYFDCILDFKTTLFPALCTEIIPIEVGESIRESLKFNPNFKN